MVEMPSSCAAPRNRANLSCISIMFDLIELHATVASEFYMR